MRQLQNYFHTLIFHLPSNFLLFEILICIWLIQMGNSIAFLILFCVIIFYLKEIHLPLRQLLFLSIVVLILMIQLFFESHDAINTQPQDISFSKFERISDIKKTETIQSFVATTEQEKVLVYAPVNFKIGIHCTGKGKKELIKVVPESAISYYFLSQHISHQLSIDRLTCQEQSDFTYIQYYRDMIQSALAFYGTTGDLYFMLFLGGNSQAIVDSSLWQTLGIIHLMSLSGLQIQLLLHILEKICSFFPFGEKTRARIQLVFLSLYALLCIKSLSLFRLILLKCVSLITSKKHEYSLNILITTVFLILFPSLFYSIGFWFSVLMQMHIQYAQTLFERYQLSKFWRHFFLIGSLFLLTLFISSLYHQSISPLYMLSNAVFVTYFEFILLPITIIGLLIFPFQAQVILVYTLTDNILQKFMYFVENKVILIHEMITAQISLILIVQQGIKYRSIQKILAILFISISLITASMTFIPRVLETQFIFLDVGQGDSTLFFNTQTQSVMLIDTGPPSNHYLSKLKQHLYRLGKTHIDYFVVTHTDNDHSGNAQALLQDEEIRPHHLILPNTVRTEKLLSLEKTHQRSTHFVDYENNPFLQYNSELKIDILNPGYHLEDENEESIVLAITIGSQHVLLQADAGLSFEQKIKQPPKNISILKVAHHGSKTGSSAAFIHQTHPRYSIISAAKNNHFGHPAAQTLQQLNNVNSTVIETAKEGDITFICNHNNCYQSR